MAKFRTRARTIDMLGRQQIAGVATAISELFKNAFDAWADNVEIDYYRNNDVFSLRDNGLGMTLEDFLNRWLVIGTESKIQTNEAMSEVALKLNLLPRPVTGEKGIGRLAIAIIGPQVLILSRARRPDGMKDLVASFINWTLFECPGINLDQVIIPTQTFPGGTIPDTESIQLMVGQVKDNLHELRDSIDPYTYKLIESELNNFKVDPQTIISQGGPSLLDDGFGTHFYISPSNEEIVTDLDTEISAKSTSRLYTQLTGFNNTMVPGAPIPLMKTSFRYWTLNDITMFDILNDKEFFLPEEFEYSDHFISGIFDNHGTFKGKIRVFDKKYLNESFKFYESINRKTRCGPFKITIAYVQGRAVDSNMEPNAFAEINDKLDKIGGIYIYRDGIRVLPYGGPSQDFLELEEKRSKGAGYYFFSYRRMFGAIEIGKDTNIHLVDKAGREGFQENGAYRDFVGILSKFLEKVTAKYYRNSGELAKSFLEHKANVKRSEQARKEREKISREKQNKLHDELEVFFLNIKNQNPKKETQSILEELKNRVTDTSKITDLEIKFTVLINLEKEALERLAHIKQKYLVEEPRDFGLTLQLNRDWNSYMREHENLEISIFNPTEINIHDYISPIIALQQSKTEKYKLKRELLENICSNYSQKINHSIEETRNTLSDITQKLFDLFNNTQIEVERSINDIKNELKISDIEKLSDCDIILLQHKLEEKIYIISNNYNSLIQHISLQLKDISWIKNRDGFLISNAEMTAALESEALAFRERAEADLEINQLGKAIEVISHEFGNSIKSIRTNLKDLKAWAAKNPKLNDLCENINTDFNHLDSYLGLFTPLHKRLYRHPVAISGTDILVYLNNLFDERIKHANINFSGTDAFKKAVINGYPSTFYPVFMNLVDNSLFWLAENEGAKIIKLDYQGASYVVSDNGPGIQINDRGAIFEWGFSRKPGGSGLGLFISKEILKREGYELKLVDPVFKQGASFEIHPIKFEEKAGEADD